MSKTPNQVIQNLENVLASLKTKTGKSQNNLTDVVGDMADKPQRAITTIAAATTDKTNELKVSATNNQATGYVEGSSQSNDLTIGLSANGATVSAKWGNTVVATQKVTTIGRATTDIGTVANDTNDTLTITATNSQGTGYVVADSNKNTASKIVTLSIAKPTIDASGNVTAIATAQDNSTTPVKVSKTSSALALGIGSLSVSGNIVTTSAGYYSSATSTTVATVSRATISHNTAANDNNDTLTITSTSVQETGYVTGGSESATTIVTLGISKPSIDKNTGIVTAIATVQDNSTTPVKVEKTSENLSLGLSSLSVNGPTVTSSEGFTTGGSATVESGSVAATATVNSPSITLTPSAISLTNKTATVSGKTRVAAAPSTATNNIDTYYIAVEAGTSATNSTASITATANANIGKDGYLYTSNSTNATASATASATISATTTTHYIPLATGGYTVSGGGLTAGTGSATAAMTATGMSLGAEATVAPSTGPYIKVEGSGVVNRAAITATQSAGYIPSATTSQEKISSSSTTSNTATVFYPITPVTRADVQVAMKKKTESHNVDTIIITASNNQSAGYVAPDGDSTENYKETTRIIQLEQVIDEITDNYGIFYGTKVSDITEEGKKTEITYVYENLDPMIKYTEWPEQQAAASSNIEKNKVAFINGEIVYGNLEKVSGRYYSAKPEVEDDTVFDFCASNIPKQIVEESLHFSVDKTEFGTAKAEEVKAGVTFTSENGLKRVGTAVDSSNLHVDYVKQSYLTPTSGTNYNDSKGYYTVAALESCPSSLPEGWKQHNKAYVEEYIDYDYPDTGNSSTFVMEMVNTDKYYYVNVYINLVLLYTDSYGQQASTTRHKLTIPPNSTNSFSREFPGVGTFTKWDFEIVGYRLGVTSDVM